MPRTISILLAGEFPAEHSELRAILAANPHFLIIGEVTNCLDLLAKVEELKPQLVILDLDLAGGDIFETISATREKAVYTPILVITRQDSNDAIFAAIKAGVLGYLVISDVSQLLIIKSIEDVARGESALSPRIARKLIRELHRPVQLPPTDESLTEQEVEVLILVARGFSNLEISETMAIEERTVRTYISNILSKLHLANRTQIAFWALKEGTVEIGKLSRHFQKVQDICHQLRGTLEGPLDGEPAFWVGGKVFAIYLELMHPDRSYVLLLPVAHGTQDSLFKQSPHKFFHAPRYADQGWVAADLTQLNEEELRYYLHQAWKLVSSK